MAAVAQKRIVHKQFNSPIGLYSDTNIKATLDRDLKMLSNGAVGIAFENSDEKPACLANSAVLRYLEEEEAAKAKANSTHRSQIQYRKCRSIDRDAVMKINRGHRIQRDSSWPPKESLVENDLDNYLKKLGNHHEKVDTIKHDYIERVKSASNSNRTSPSPNRTRSKDQSTKINPKPNTKRTSPSPNRVQSDLKIQLKPNTNRAASEENPITSSLQKFKSVTNLNEIETISIQDVSRRSTTPSLSDLKPPMSPRAHRKLKQQSSIGVSEQSEEDDQNSENVTNEFVYVNTKSNCLNLSKQILQEAEQHLNQFELNLKQHVYNDEDREAICNNLYTLEHSIMELITKLNRINQVNGDDDSVAETVVHANDDMKRLESSHDKFYQAARLLMDDHYDRDEGLKKVAWPPHQSSPARTFVQQQQQPHQPSPQYQQPPPQQQEYVNCQQARSVTPNPSHSYQQQHHQPQQQPQQQHYHNQSQPQQYQQRQYQTLPRSTNDSAQYNTAQSRHQSQPPHQQQSQQQYSSPQSSQPSYVNRQPNTQSSVRPAYIKSPAQLTVTTGFSGGIPVVARPTSNQSNINQYSSNQSPQPQYQPPQQQYHQPQYQSQSPQQQQQQRPYVESVAPSTPQYNNVTPSTAPISPSPAHEHSLPIDNRSVSSNSPSGWSHVRPAIPVHTGYTRQRSAEPLYNSNINNQYNPQWGYQSSAAADNFGSAQNQYQPQATQAFQPVAAPQQQYNQAQQYQQPGVQQQQYQPVQQQKSTETYQRREEEQYNYLQQQYDSYRQGSPGVITLRDSAPISQKPAPVFAAQPATQSYGGGSTMRGDQKWPPEGVQTPAELENEARRRLAAGPTCRPRRANKDYSQFFAQHALNSTYPGYRAPPGTQHFSTQFN